jgi:hypothetical protein
MSIIKSLAILSFILLQLLQFSFQQTTNANANTTISSLSTCAKMLDNKMPVRPSDCTSDKSNAGNNCCYITSTINGQTTGICYLVPSGADVKNTGSIVSGLGIDAKVDCSAGYVKVNVFTALIVLVFALFI